ncbi:hypothetical protein MSPP1_000062 [Malassezia sp. CBS 17886]|nr:hypothetical protein MSPP1_000062 [Malassezia sp. CBS 17886]
MQEQYFELRQVPRAADPRTPVLADAPVDSSVRSTHGLRWARENWFGFKSPRVPYEATRDFGARERTYLSLIKFTTAATVLSGVMFLQLQLNPTQTPSPSMHAAVPVSVQPDGSVVVLPDNLVHPSKGRAAPRPAAEPLVSAVHTMGGMAPFDLGVLPDTPGEPISRPTEARVLGSIFLVVAVLLWVVSTYEYFSAIAQLEREQIYLDECEGDNHPLVTVTYCFVGVVVLATIILLLVQHTTQG